MNNEDMQKYSIQSILDLAQTKLSACELEGPAGSYRIRPDREAVSEPEATAAAVNIKYMLSQPPQTSGELEEWVETLQGYQDKEDGLFDHGTKSIEISAACISSLSCFGQRAKYPISAIDELTEVPKMVEYLQQLCWCENPEKAARLSAAVFTLLTLNRKVSHAWRESFNHWVHTETDPHTGLLRQGCITPVEVDGQWTLLPYLCAIIYPIALENFSHQPLCMPWRLIDTALEVMEFHRVLFFKRRGHRHLPWIFCLSRSMRQTAHRHEEVRQVLIRFIPDYLNYLENQMEEGHFQSLRQIQWDLSALAELQLALPGRLQSDYPLRQILDHHPFL